VHLLHLLRQQQLLEPEERGRAKKPAAEEAGPQTENVKEKRRGNTKTLDLAMRRRGSVYSAGILMEEDETDEFEAYLEEEGETRLRLTQLTRIVIFVTIAVFAWLAHFGPKILVLTAILSLLLIAAPNASTKGDVGSRQIGAASKAGYSRYNTAPSKQTLTVCCVTGVRRYPGLLDGAVHLHNHLRSRCAVRAGAPPPAPPPLPRPLPPHSPSHELRAVQTPPCVDIAPPAAQGVLVILSIEVLLVLAAPSKKDDGTKRHQWR
jgi:hypothetical protein